MPLRTVMNYQYRFGSTTTSAIYTLYEDGGWTRYYQGLTAALFQGPISRFGDTAANVGMLALLNSNSHTSKFPEPVKTVFASLAAATFRIVLTPIDTIKTTLQTQGKSGIKILKDRVGLDAPPSLMRILIYIFLLDSEVWYRNHVVWCLGYRCCNFRGPLSSMIASLPFSFPTQHSAYSGSALTILSNTPFLKPILFSKIFPDRPSLVSQPPSYLIQSPIPFVSSKPTDKSMKPVLATLTLRAPS